MNCEDIDIKGFVLGELTATEREEAERHAAACAGCREEIDRLRLTRTALLAVRDEEVPQRIAFVSDGVFEPSWWRRLGLAGPRWGFASAALLSAAILGHGLMRPAPPSSAPALDAAAVSQMVEREVARRLENTVAQAVAAAAERQEQRTAELLAAAGKRFDLERRADMLAVEENFKYLRKQVNVMQLAGAYRAFDGGAR
jgi:anti-sigma factor RsiW